MFRSPKYAPDRARAQGGAEPRSADPGRSARRICRASAPRGQALRSPHLCASASRHCARPCPADQRPLQSGAQAAAAAQLPPTGRRRHGGTCADSPRRRQWSAESSEGVIYAPGRPAVCKRGLLPAARGLSGEPEGVGRLRTNDAALCRALCRFRAAAAACGHGGRAAAAGAQDVRVCRRIRFPFLVFRARTSWLSKRYLYPPSQQHPLPKDHAASTSAALALFHTAVSAGIWI